MRRTMCQTKRPTKRQTRRWAALGVLALSLGAQAPASADTPQAAVPTHGPVAAPDPANVTRATLSNGLRVVIVVDRLAPVVTTEINYLAGSVDAPQGFPGTAHALEHMMFRGSNGLDRDQLSEVASQIGGNYNADTTERVTQFFYTVPADDLKVALHIEALRMTGALLRQQDWDKERGAIEQEVSRDLSSPIYLYLSQLQGILFAGTPYEHDALGTRPSFDRTDAGLLRKFYETWYAPNNAILVIAGDVDPQATLAQVSDMFGKLPRKDLPAHPAITPGAVAAKSLALPTDLSIGLATIAWPLPGLKDHDFAAADILADVLGSQRSALFGLVVDGKSLTSEFAYIPKPDVGYGVAVGGFPKGADPTPLLASMRAIMADAAKNGVDPELVAAAKRQELAQLAFRNNDISGVAEAWSNALAFQGLNAPDDLARAYQAVTVADVNRVAKALLDPSHAVTAVLTPQDSGKPISGKGYGGAESFASTPDHPVSLPDWATAAVAQLVLPKPTPTPSVTTLPNGLRLIVLPTQVSPTVSVYGQIREVPEMQEPAGHEGVSDLVGQMLSYGTEQHDRLAYRKALDDIAASSTAGTSFSLQVLKPQFAAGMALLAENELHPAFPAQAYAVVQQQDEQSLAGLLHTPDYLFNRAGDIAIAPPGDPSLREATPATVAATSLADLRAYYQASFRPDLTTIVVIGDVTQAEAKQVVQASFGGWGARGPTPAIDLPKIPPSKTSQTHVPDSRSVQDSVVLTESLPLTPADPDRYTLMLGNTILGGGFSSRLYNDLRVHGGYVYTVDSSIDWSRTRATYSISYGADPDKRDKAAALAIRDLQAMQQAPVSPAELDRAKAQTLRRLPMQRASVDDLAKLYLRLIELGLPLDAPDVAAARYFNTTAPELQAAFAKWMRPPDLAQIVKGP